MNHPDAVTLDLFGTLLDFSVQRDEPPLVADLLASTGQEDRAQAVLATWMRSSLADRSRQPFRPVRATLVRGARQAALEHGLAIEPDAWADALEALWASQPLHPDALEALDRITSAGVPCAIVSNLDRFVLDRVLTRHALRERVDAAVCSEHARAYKPHPRPFRMALARIDADPAGAVHVGDRPSEDRAGARAAGMRCRILDRSAGEGLVETLAGLGLG